MSKGWLYPEASERQLSRSLQEAVRDLVVLMRSKVKGMKFDATDAEINEAEEEILSLKSVLISALIGSLPSLAFAIYKFNTKQFINVAKRTGGKKNPIVLLLIAVGPTRSEDWYSELEREWQSMARQSIEKLLDNIVNDWSAEIRRANFTSKSRKEVNEIAARRYVVYRSWAKNRASGIVGSWNSRLMRQRLYDVGVDSYIWRGMLDERERLSHVALEGKEIKLSDRHIFPGEEYGCRCWAQPNWTRRSKDEEGATL